MPNYTLSESKSNILHLLRWASALVVVIGHTAMVDRLVFGDRKFVLLYKYISNNAHSAVMLFFVLSGYLISFTSSKRDSTGRSLSTRKYLVDRWSRIFSVLIPCLLLTVILDFTGSRLFPIIYQNPEIIPQDTGLLRFVVNLLALQGTWGSRIQFGSNSPLWSIGYEFSFYLMFGLYVYARENPNRTRVLFIGGIVCIAAKGPLLVGYALIWLMGLTSHQFASRYKIRLSFLSFSLAVALMLVCNHYIMLVDIFKLPRFSSDFVFSLTIALFLFFEYPDVKFNGYWKKLLTLNRVMANFSYTLYATHLPVMLLVYAATFNYFLDLKRLNATSLGIIVGLFSVSFAYLFSKISEEKRGGYRIVADELISGLLLRWRCSRAC